MTTTELYDIDPFYPEGEDYYDGPEFWFDGGAGCCPCGGPGCDGSCDTYYQYRQERKAADFRDEPEAWGKRLKRGKEQAIPDGKYVYIWHNREAWHKFLMIRPVAEDEIPF